MYIIFVHTTLPLPNRTYGIFGTNLIYAYRKYIYLCIFICVCCELTVGIVRKYFYWEQAVWIFCIIYILMHYIILYNVCINIIDVEQFPEFVQYKFQFTMDICIFICICNFRQRAGRNYNKSVAFVTSVFLSSLFS